jgi:hypothetical protein
VSTLAAAPERPGEQVPASSAPAGSPAPTTDAVLGFGLAVALVVLAFLSTSSSDQTVAGTGVWSEIAVTLLGAAACVAMVLLCARGRGWGVTSVVLFAAFTGFAGLSIAWSVQPDWSWFGANQLLSYLAVFTGAAAIARTFPQRWPALLGGLAAAMVAVSAYSLLAKVFPASLAPNNSYGRLQAPFGYWNAVGLAAALGLPACVWSAARRGHGWLLRGLSVPAMTLLIAVIALSYSRSAALVAVIGVGCFVAFTPVRLRATLMLALGTAGAVPVVAWALGHHGLTGDNALISAQSSAGHSFGWILVIVMAVMAGVGIAAAIASDRVAISAPVRRRVGTALVVGVALIPVAGVAGLAASSRGLTGEISHAWHTLTSPTSKQPGDTSSRITQLGSSRPLYWHQGLQVGEHALLKGVGELGYGIARLQYTTNPAKSDQAHSYLVQTFADLGLIGLVITLGLLVAWVWAALRPLAVRTPWRRLSAAQAGEREGLVALAAVVVAFGVHSALDWTWYFPGVAIPALLAAGWLAGRGPLLAPVGRLPTRRPLRERPAAGAVMTVVAAVALIGAWVMWQPLRSVQAMTAAENASSNSAAFADARTAAGADPLSIWPLFELSNLYHDTGDNGSARSELVQATRLQPDSPDPWLLLAQFDVQNGRPRAAIAEADRVVALDHTPDPDTQAAAVTITAANATLARRAAQRTARARSRRRHSGHPPAPRTST